MTRQVTDNLYIELDYFTPEEYYTYEAVAASAQSTEFAIVCDAELVAGAVIEFVADFNSDGATSITVNKIANGVAAFSSEFTQSATISHIHGSDLFAFTEAAIAVQVDRIRDNNIAASDVFSVATDVERIQQGDADADAVFSAIIDGLRSRDVNLDAQAAFSFAAELTKLAAVITVSADIVSEFTISVTARQIRDAHLTGTGVATVVCDAIKQIEISATFNSAFQQNTNSGFKLESSAAFTVSSFLFSDPFEYPRRGVSTYSGNTAYSSVGVDLSANRFGTGSLRLTATQGTNFPTSGFHPVWHNNEYWHFVSGATYRSSDGVNWSVQGNNLPAGHCKVTRSNTFWTTTITSNPGNAQQTTITLYYSTDGLTFTSRAVTTFDAWQRGFDRPNSPVSFFENHYYVFYTRANGWGASRTQSLASPSWVTGGSTGSTGGLGLSGSPGGRLSIPETFGNTIVLANDNTVNAPATQIWTISGTTWTNTLSLAGQTSVPTAFYDNRNAQMRFETFSNKIYGWTSAGGFTDLTPSQLLFGFGSYRTYRTGSNWLGYLGTNAVLVDQVLQQSTLTYTDISNDLSNWKTLDLWFVWQGGSSAYTEICSQTDGTKLFRLSVSGSFVRLEINNGSGLVTLSQNPPLSGSGWKHLRIVQDSGVISGYISGTRVFTASYTPPTFNTGMVFRSSDGLTFIDEFLLSDAVLNSPSATSFTAPTTKWTNNANTDLLLHFDGSLVDDSRVEVIPSAALTSQVSLTANTTIAYSLSVNLSSQSQLTCLGQRSVETILIAFNNATLTASIDKIKEGASAISAQASQSADISITKQAVADVQSTADISATSLRTKQLSSELTTEAFTVTVAFETQDFVADLSSEFVTNAAVSYIPFVNAAFAVTTTLTASIRTDVFVAMVVSSSAAVVAEVVKTTDVNVLQVNEFTLTADAVKTTNTSATTIAEFTVFCNAVTTSEISLVAFSNANVSAIPEVTKSFDSALICQFTLIANTADSLNKTGSANISSEFTVLATANFTVDNVIITQAIASNLTVVVKTVAVDIPLDSNCTISADVSRIRSSQITASAISAVSITISKTVGFDSPLTSTFTQTVVVGRIRNVGITTQAIASNLTAVVRIAGLLITSNVVSTLTASGVVRRSAQSAFISTATLSVTAVKQSVGNAVIISQGTVSATISLRKQFASAVTSALTFVVAIRDLRLDEIVYVIPGENYVYEIISESRLHDIYGETRIRSVLGESRNRRITGESRIHIID